MSLAAPARNWPLLIKVILYIAHHPEEWNQKCWADFCGTTFCFAGHAVVLSGHEFVRDRRGFVVDDLVPVKGIPGVTYEAFDHEVHGWVVTAGSAAQALLGLSYDEAADLFAWENTFGRIYGLLCAWAAADGIELPLELHAAAEVMEAAEL